MTLKRFMLEKIAHNKSNRNSITVLKAPRNTALPLNHIDDIL